MTYDRPATAPAPATHTQDTDCPCTRCLAETMAAIATRDRIKRSYRHEYSDAVTGGAK